MQNNMKHRKDRQRREYVLKWLSGIPEVPVSPSTPPASAMPAHASTDHTARTDGPFAAGARKTEKTETD